MAGCCLLHLSQLGLCLLRGRPGLPLRPIQVHLPPVDPDERDGHLLGPGRHLLLVGTCGSSPLDVSPPRISRQVGIDTDIEYRPVIASSVINIQSLH